MIHLKKGRELALAVFINNFLFCFTLFLFCFCLSFQSKSAHHFSAVKLKNKTKAQVYAVECNACCHTCAFKPALAGSIPRGGVPLSTCPEDRVTYLRSHSQYTARTWIKFFGHKSENSRLKFSFICFLFSFFLPSHPFYSHLLFFPENKHLFVSVLCLY